MPPRRCNVYTLPPPGATMGPNLFEVAFKFNYLILWIETTQTAKVSWVDHSIHIMLSDPVWSCLILSDPVWSCIFLSDLVWSCLILSDPVCSCLLLSAPVWSCLILSDTVWYYLVQMNPNENSSEILYLIFSHQSILWKEQYSKNADICIKSLMRLYQYFAPIVSTIANQGFLFHGHQHSGKPCFQTATATRHWVGIAEQGGRWARHIH